MAMTKKQAAEALERLKQTLQDAGVNPEVVDSTTPQQFAEAAEHLEAECNILLATTPVKQAIAEKIAEAHEAMHKMANAIAVAGFISTQRLQPEDSEAEIRNLMGFQSYIKVLSTLTVQFTDLLCEMHHRIDGNITPIPGIPTTENQIPELSGDREPDNDFVKFMAKLQAGGNA